MKRYMLTISSDVIAGSEPGGSTTVPNPPSAITVSFVPQ